MRVAVFGAGAVGSVVGGLLSKEHQVTLIGREEHVLAVNEGGLHISGIIDRTVRPLARTSVRGLPVQDVVLITTKAYDTPEAVRQVACLTDERSVVLSLQNGLDNMNVLSEAFGPRAVVGVPFMGATYLGPGQVRYAGHGEIVLGSLEGRKDMVGLALEVLGASGIVARPSADIGSVVWLKAIVNASINPLTALVRQENGFLLSCPELLEVSRWACQEGAEAARSNGVDLGSDDPFIKVRAVLEATASNRSSMLQDVERGRRTEIDQINGALADRGEAKGVPMPVNRTLWSLVRAL